MARFGKDFDVADEHVHVCENADAVFDGVECFSLGFGSGREHDGGGECEEC